MKDVYCLQAELPTWVRTNSIKLASEHEQLNIFVFTIYNHFHILYLQARRTLRYVLHPSDVLRIKTTWLGFFPCKKNLKSLRQ